MSFNCRISIDTELRVNGELVDYIDTLTMRGLETIASCLGSPFNFDRTWMPYIAIGDGDIDPGTEDRVLENELFRELCSVSRFDNELTMSTSFGEDEPTGACTVREVGLINDIGGGDLGARWSLVSDLSKAAIDILEVSCKIIFQS